VTWPVVRLGDVAHTALGKMLDKAKSKGHAQVPYLRNVNVQWGRIDTEDLLTMELDDNERERFAVEAGDLLVCEGGDIGRCAIWHGRAEYLAYQKALHRIRPGDRLDTLYLRYLLEHHALSGQLAKLATGTTIAHLPQQQLRRVPVPLPPIDVQRRVVNLLEDHLSRLHASSGYLAASRRRLVALERSALDAQFGGTDISLADLIEDISSGKSFGAANVPACDGEWGIIKVSAMTWGQFDPAENKAVTDEGRVDPRFEIRSGDLLVSRANTSELVGASVLVRDVRPKLLLSDKSLRLKPRSEVNAEWLWRALQAPSARRQMSAFATGTKDSMRNISQAALKRVLLPNVSTDEQVAALKSFNEVADAIVLLRREVETSAQRLEALRRSLLGAAFSGRLGGAPSEPSAAKEMINA